MGLCERPDLYNDEISKLQKYEKIIISKKNLSSFIASDFILQIYAHTVS